MLKIPYFSYKRMLSLCLAVSLLASLPLAAFGAVPPLPGPAYPSVYDDFANPAGGTFKQQWSNWYNQSGGTGTYTKTTVDGRTVGKFTQTPTSGYSWAKFEPQHDIANFEGYRYLTVVMKNPGYANSRIRFDISDGSANYWMTAFTAVPADWTTFNFDMNQFPDLNKKNAHISIWLNQTGGEYGEMLVDEIRATSEYSGTAPTLTAAGIDASTGFENTTFTFDATYTDADNEPPVAMEIVLDDSTIYKMEEVSSADNTYTDGKAYTFSARLPAGGHSYYFRAADGTSDPTATSSQNVTVNGITQLIDINDNTTGAGLNQFQYEGAGWQYDAAATGSYQSDNHYTATTDEYAAFRFIGTQVKLYGTKGPDKGIAAISIDNGAELHVDTYAPTRQDNVLLYASPALSNSIHSLKARVTGFKNASSSGTQIAVDRTNVNAYAASLIDSINVSQAGYSANAYKAAKVTAVDAMTDLSYEILDGTDVIASGTMTDEGVTWNKHVYTIDFSAVTQTGSNFTVRSNGVSSYVFPIQTNMWDAYKDEMTTFYRLQRLEDTRAAYPEGYSSIAPSDKVFHPASFQDDAVIDGTHYDLTGGWHDAGDYGKYAGNMWVIGNIAISYNRHADSPLVSFDNDSNGIPDLIDEAKYGSDYLMKFADQLDGALYDFNGHTSFQHPEKVTDNIIGTADDRKPVQVAVNGSAKGAGSLAATARAISIALDNGDISAPNLTAMEEAAANYTEGALVLYNYAMNNQSGNQGSYTSGINNALLFAEVQLALLTNDAGYIDSASDRIANFPDLRATNYWDMGPLAFAEFYPLADTATKTKIQQALKKELDGFLSSVDDTPYGVINQFGNFGVNEPHAGYVADAIRYYELFNDPSALRAATEGLYWMVGSNPWNFSWVSGVGTDFVKYLHTRLDEQAYDAALAGIVIPGALVSGPNLKDPLNPVSASPWYEDRGLFQDNMSSWRYNEYSISIQAGLFYSVMALTAMNPGDPAVANAPSGLSITSPITGEFVRGNVTVFAEPDPALSSIESNLIGSFTPMTDAGDGVYKTSYDTSALAPLTNRRVDVRGTESTGAKTISTTYYRVAPPLPSPSAPSLYDDFGGNGSWGSQGLAWVNWWNQDGGTATYAKTTVDGRTVGKFTQTPASQWSRAKFQPWHTRFDLSGYRFLTLTMKNPGFADSRIRVDINDGLGAGAIVSNGNMAVADTWTDYTFDLDAIPNLNKKNLQLTLWLVQAGGQYGEMLIDEIKGTNVQSGTAPALTNTGISPTVGHAETDFTFTATYTDANNQKPFVVEVVVDGVIHEMSPLNTADETYTDGKTYSYTTKLPLGTHSYYFTTSDTTTNAVSTSVQSGPAVGLGAPEPSTAIPGKIEAENYSGMSGIQTQNTNDTGGGLNVGWIDTGDWMDYEVDVDTTGLYQVEYRIASGAAAGHIQLKSGETVLSDTAVPNSGGYQNWRTVTDTVELPAGVQTLRLYASGGGFNMNWINFQPATITSIPGKVQAENYSGMSGIQTQTTTDADGGLNVGWIHTGDWMDYVVDVNAAGTYALEYRVASTEAAGQIELKSGETVLAATDVPNTGGSQTWATVTEEVELTAGVQTLRLHASGGGFNLNWFGFTYVPDPSFLIPGKIEAEAYDAMSGIQTQNSSDAGGGVNVGWVDTGDWMDYVIGVNTPGLYKVEYRVASSTAAGQIELKSGESVLATKNVPSTGGNQSWTTLTGTVELPDGVQTLRLHASGGGFNLNWLNITALEAAAVPGKIEAEAYIGMNGIQTQATTDTDGGLNVGWVHTGDWMDYVINVDTAGSFTVEYRVASNAAAGLIELKSAETVLAATDVPVTGGNQSWTTITDTVELAAGVQTIRVHASGGGFNLNWLSFTGE